mgnify:CR=1 FL=1
MPARTIDEHGCDNEETEHRVLDGERICDERTANIRGARMEALGRGEIRESEERPPNTAHPDGQRQRWTKIPRGQ